MIFLKTSAIIIPVFFAVLVFPAVLFSSCIRHSSEPAKRYSQYFSIQGYFRKEASILARLNPVLVKTISVNGKLQTKRLDSINWINELSLFTASDINKPAWIGKYRIDSTANDITYTALDSNLKVRRIEIKKNQFSALHPIRVVKINIRVKNFLYSLNEELFYYTDSLYTIKRRQRINLLGSKFYEITGQIKRR